MNADDEGTPERESAPRESQAKATDAPDPDGSGSPHDDDEAPESDGVDGPVVRGSDDAGGAHPASVSREMGSVRGWVLVGVLAFCLLGAPALILWRPPGIPYWAALLALPMLPAIVLGIVGVWATTRP